MSSASAHELVALGDATKASDLHPATVKKDEDNSRVSSPISPGTSEAPTEKQLHLAIVLPSSSPEVPYSVYTKKEKWIIAAIVAFAGMFSPLTANVYFPAIPVIAAEFHESIENINLTVTVYMVIQGIAPMVWGTFADRKGRRPMFLACLLILTLSCVGLALTPVKDYWLLMLLRCIQAAGSASTIALAAGVISDFASPAERGGYFGVSGIGALLGPAVGPVIGGGLAQQLGWRAIFWFLVIAAAICFLVLLCFLPETLRTLVGNGSIRPPAIYRPLIPAIGRHASSGAVDTRPPPMPSPNPFILFTYIDVDLLLFMNGLVYMVLYAVLAPMSNLFHEDYPFLDETNIGLCFLAIGWGMILGTVVTGKLLDKDYRRMRKAFDARVHEEGLSEDDFPIEWARQRTAPFYTIVLAIAVAGFGWAIKARTHLAVPLLLQMIIGYCIVAIQNFCQTLTVDMFHTRSASVTACNNLARCSLGAMMTAVVDLILRHIGQGWAYVVMSGIALMVLPVWYLEVTIGPKLRRKRGPITPRVGGGKH